jgi:serine/threonine-protein kinase
MREHVTLLRPEAQPDSGPSDARGISSALPPDLLEQVRGRVQLLALLLLVAFVFDPTLSVVTWIGAALTRSALPPDFFVTRWFEGVDLAAAAASLGLWWLARRRSVSPSRLLDVGLAYEVIVCFEVALSTFWQHWLANGQLPNLTWVPAVIILFPLIMPGPPRRMLVAAIAAGAMSPLALLILDATGSVPAGAEDYVRTSVHSGFAILFANVGARVVYGLGREVVASRELGSYHLEERLGQGGMGEVWSARHRLLARPAAIKLIRPQAAGGGRVDASSDLARRFEREAQTIARLRSPHTVDLFDFGVAEDGAFYYVMELLEGLDADTMVRRHGPVPPERAIHLLRQVCHSLSEAESCGLVHRDIKPANIFLCRYGEDCDFVKVLDFGLVKALDESAGNDTVLTRENAVHGTPAFMAPEQVLGRDQLDGRADIYATGCVAYWLLTGDLVFSGDTPMEILMNHVHTPPSPPSRRSELPVPEELDRLVLSCLAKDPAERPQSARALSQRLGEIDGAEAWTESRAREWWAKHQPVAAVRPRSSEERGPTPA